VRTGGFRGALLATLIVASLMALAISLLSVSPSSAALEGLTPHDPIMIVGNDDFTAANGVVAGSGTADDPYIIEGWDIKLENAPRWGFGSGISIRNTNAHFILRNSYVHDGSFTGYSGIFFTGVTNGRIDNVISEKNEGGIELGGSDNNIISNSIVRNNSSPGIALSISSNSKNNIISNCIVENNDYGIHFSYSDNNTISNCIVGDEILVIGRYNLIFNNLLENSSIFLPHVYPENDPQVVNNRIYHNNFINTVVGDGGTNYWDDGYPSGGNYWSDYTGEDLYQGPNQDIPGSDEIGDIPYNILEGNRDRYPLMKPFGEAPSGPSDERNWSLLAGIVGIIVVIGIGAALYMRRRKPTEFRW